LNSNKGKLNFKILDNTVLKEDDMYSYRLDYEIMSSNTPGANNRGTIYLRGTFGKVYDNFTFSIEKQNDFTDSEAFALIAAYEEAFKPRKSTKPKSTKSNLNKGNPFSGIFGNVNEDEYIIILIIKYQKP